MDTRIMTARPEFGDAIAVEVTQADREAAAGRLTPTSERDPISLTAARIREGRYDAHAWVQEAAASRVSSTALPLAHPAAPQGWDRAALIQAGMHESTNEADGDLIPYGVAIRALHDLRAALAPAAIASGLEGAAAPAVYSPYVDGRFVP